MKEQKQGHGGHRPGAGRKRSLPLSRRDRREKAVRKTYSIYCTESEYLAIKSTLADLRRRAEQEESYDQQCSFILESAFHV